MWALGRTKKQRYEVPPFRMKRPLMEERGTWRVL